MIEKDKNIDKNIEEYPKEIDKMYTDAMLAENEKVQYEMLLTIAENVNETKDEVNVNINFEESI